jgi:hypothetical protein
MRRGQLYAVIDACDEPEVPRRLWARQPNDARCLYHGLPNQENWGFGPWLAVVDKDLLEWIRAGLQPASWGLLIDSTLPFAALHEQLRELVFVDTPDAGRLLFRFYDPRVLPGFLAMATAEQRAMLFAGVRRYGVLASPADVHWLAPTGS